MCESLSLLLPLSPFPNPNPNPIPIPTQTPFSVPVPSGGVGCLIFARAFGSVLTYVIGTLREGEQFANAFFTTEQKIKIATMLSDFGADYIEITSPVSSPQSFEDCKTICKLGLKAKILTHVRCNMDDAKKAVECGVDGVDLVIGTSSFLRQYSHGKSLEMIKTIAIEVIEYVKRYGLNANTSNESSTYAFNSQGVEVRFSSEDSFRSDLVDLLTLYKAVDKAGVNRVGVADTVGGATPRMTYDLIRTLRSVVGCDIETHFHDDTGCAVGNAISALEAGATHVDTSVLGIGERNGITPLGAMMARMVVSAPEYTKSKYNLKMLKHIEEYVASCVQVNVPVSRFFHGIGIARGCCTSSRIASHQFPTSVTDIWFPSLTIQSLERQLSRIRLESTPRLFWRTLRHTRSLTPACSAVCHLLSLNPLVCSS